MIRNRRIFVLTCAAAAGLAACGGGAGGGVPVPVQTSTPTPNPAATTFAVQAFPTSIPLPPLNGYNTTLNLPGITGIGNVSVSVQIAPTPGSAPLSRRRHAASAPIDLPILVVSLTPQNAITLRGAPGFTVTVPAGVNLAGDNYYSAYQSGSQWLAVAGPSSATAQSVTVAQNSTAPAMDLPANQATSFALFGTGATSINMRISAPLLIGSPGPRTLTATAFDGFGAALSGVFRTPMQLSDNDATGHTSLSAASLSSSSDSVQLTYDGHGDSLVLSALEQHANAQLPVISALGPDTLTSSTSPMIAGSDGNLWMQSGNGVAKISPTLQTVQYSDPNSTYHWRDNSAIAEDSAGNIWVDYHDAYVERPGLDRFSHGGSLTNFLFTDPSMGDVSSMTRGPDGDVWFGSGNGVYRVDPSGSISLVAPVGVSAMNMVLGPDGNVWFSSGGNVYRLTAGGSVTSFAFPQPASTSNYLTFAVGPDGNFWAPFAYGTLNLIKFNTAGSVVSTTPMTYAAPWAPSYFWPTGSAGFIGDSHPVRDTAGNMYFADFNAQGVFRIAADGTETAYCTLPATTNVFNLDPIYLAFGNNGKLYVSYYTNPPSGAGMLVPAITLVDPLSW